MKPQAQPSNSFLALAFAAFALVGAVASLIGLVGFLSNTLHARTIDAGPSSSTRFAWVVDVLLVALFGLQHSLMARAGFKRWSSRFVPLAFERSVYVLASALALGALTVAWLPLPAIVWELHAPAVRAGLWTLFALGWLLMLIATLELDPLEFAGLRQASESHADIPERWSTLHVRGLHRIVRHPTYSGWLIAAWSTPTMSHGHALFAATTTLYIAIAIVLEEQDLVRIHGPAYEEYQRRVPCLVPWNLRADLPG